MREKITERRETQSKNVWNRLDRNNDVYYPRDRERFHPYQRERTQVYKEDNVTHGRLQTKQQHLTWKPVEGNSQNKSVTVEPPSGRRSSPRRCYSPDSQRMISAPIDQYRVRRNTRENFSLLSKAIHKRMETTKSSLASWRPKE